LSIEIGCITVTGVMTLWSSTSTFYLSVIYPYIS